MILKHLVSFWKKYENLNLKVAFVLISLQIIHLYWLTTDVALQRVTGESFFVFPRELLAIFIVVDYLEIPALVSGIAFYALLIRNRPAKRGYNSLLLIFLAIQLYHIFWITDEVVYEIFFGGSIVEIPPIAAWIAIAIDYLEIPVMVDLFRRIVKRR